MQDHVQLAALLDSYGALLTRRQRTLLELTAYDDLSLAEIAEREGISRQGVLDAQKRGEQQLFTLEQTLGLVEKQERTGICIAQLQELACGLQGADKLKLAALIDEIKAAWEI